MCVLCTEFMFQVHWSDRDGDGMEISSHPKDSDNARRRRMRIRFERVRLLNTVLSYYRLTLDDWNGTKFVLRDAKGTSVLVKDLGELWLAVETLLGRRPDPLDASFIEHMVSI